MSPSAISPPFAVPLTVIVASPLSLALIISSPAIVETVTVPASAVVSALNAVALAVSDIFPASSESVAVTVDSGLISIIIPFSISSAVSVTVVSTPSTVYVNISPTSLPDTSIVAVTVPSSPNSFAL